MCACRCGIRVHLRDGELRYIDGNPEPPAEQGRDLRQGRVGDHEAVFAGAADAAAAAQGRAASAAPASSSRSRGSAAFEILEERLAQIRATDPKKFALFTGRDQMQALTGLFARQFGTPNYAAHGGFCSVNMAAGMIYTIGGSFWEFGGPDLDRAKLFVMIGTAEDHHSNPLKIAISQVQARAAAASSRSTRCAPATRRSPTSGSRSSPAPTARCFMALLHELIADDLIDRAFLEALHQRAAARGARRRARREGMFAHDPDPARARRRRPRAAQQAGLRTGLGDRHGGLSRRHRRRRRPGARGRLHARRRHARSRRRSSCCASASRRARRSGPRRSPASRAERIRRLAREMGDDGAAPGLRAADPLDRLPGASEHATTQARPVAFHAMRGLAAHSNGFQTIRALAMLMSVLGTIDRARRLSPQGAVTRATSCRTAAPSTRPR